MHSSPKKNHEVEVFGDVDPWFDYKKSKAIELRWIKGGKVKQLPAACV